jgi:hypothetical protein
MGGALDAPKVFLGRRVKPLRLGETGAFVLDAIQGANAVLGLIQAGDLSRLLVMSWKDLISCNPSIITMVPYKNYNTTGPSRAMAVWRERNVVLLQVHVLVFCPPSVTTMSASIANAPLTREPGRFADDGLRARR